MGNFKRAFTVLMSIFILVVTVLPVAASAEIETDYTITNPYASVTWNTGSKTNYKANLHCHSWASDGLYDVKDIIEKHYEFGYDALALTDHGSVNYGWTTPSYYELNVAFGYLRRKDDIDDFREYHPEVIRDKLTMPTYLTKERYKEITTGVGRNGVGMIDIPYGNEHNFASVNNAHVNTYFADYGHGVPGTTSDYETPISKAQELGGLSVINHPSEITKAEDEKSYEDAYNEDNITYSYYIDKFANLLKKYPSCLGIEINTKNDEGTKYDRKLWDILLQKVAPTGRNVYGICSGDTHSPDQFDQSWIIYCTNKKNTAENLRECLKTGAFFGGSRNIKNEKELADLGINARKWNANPNVDQPNVTNVAVDTDNNDTITIEADHVMEDADGIPNIIWIADGEVIAKGNTIDLDDHSDKIGSYVRAEILGEGGVLYSQPFLLSYSGAPEAEDEYFFDWNSIFKTIKFIFNEFLNIADLKLNDLIDLFV